MPIHSANIKITVSAIRLASKVVTRDFYEVNKLQNSKNSSGLERFTQLAYEKAKKIIQDELKRFRPQFGLSPDDNTEWYWQISPINGYSNFSRGIPFWSISISLLHQKDTHLTVIMLPIPGEIFWAEKNSGAYLDDHNNTKKLRISSKVNPDNKVIALSVINGTIFRALQGMQYRVIGSNDVNIAYTVTEKVDAVLYPNTIHDNSLLISESSGTVIHTDQYIIAGKHEIASTIAERIKNG